ncbi:MAG: hypothetical protein QOI82_2735 [Actinomycetota bacterium]|nr:hypothetical protein [Actinomycetota bacterium]
MTVLSPLDDLPIHQVAQTMATVGTSDRNFYDRYYFSLHGSDDAFFLAAGLGQYPNLGVCDGFVCVARESTQTVVRASRPLGLDRLDVSVGPLRVEVIEGLRRVRLVCEEVEGFALDVTWEGSIPAYEEPRMLLAAPHGRYVIDTMRFLQTGCWTGSMLLDGRTIEVTPDRFWGSRDRSWGVRPVGEPEPAGAPTQISGFFWNYFVAQFDGFSVIYMAQEDSNGRRTTEEGVRLWADGRVEHLGRPEHALEFVPGTRKVSRATVRFAGGTELTGEVLRPLHLARGTGYGFDADWRHGMWQGEDVVVQKRDFDTDDPSIVPMPGAIIDNVARFGFDGAVGYGLLEAMSIGPHPQYFVGWD